MSNAWIRRATAGDLVLVREIEIEADRLFAAVFPEAEWQAAPSGTERSRLPGFILVASDPADSDLAGFAHVLEIDGGDHLEQLSVRPSMTRRGHGRALVEAAKRESTLRGRKRLTLRTYADVPWNAPFYRSCGFVECDPDTDFLKDLVNVEQQLGMAAYGRRVQMKVELGGVQAR
jgi:GNAT superfamily N-acetyltransferase